MNSVSVDVLCDMENCFHMYLTNSEELGMCDGDHQHYGESG